MKNGFSLGLGLLAATLLYFPDIQANDGQPETPFESSGSGPVYYIDYANFQGVDAKTYVEFYFQVSYNDLQFYKSGKQFQAGYALDFKVIDADGNVLEQHETNDVFDVDNFAQTHATTKARVLLLGYTMDAGSYEIESSMTDLETHKSTKIKRSFVAGDFKTDKLKISDLQLSQNISAAKPDQPYVKNQRYIEPNAVRTFAHGLADIYVYFEVYNLSGFGEDGKSPGNYEAHFIINDESGNTFARLKRKHAKPGETSAHSIKLPIEHFKNGTYSLTVQIVDQESGQMSESSKDFTVFTQSITANEMNVNELYRN